MKKLILYTLIIQFCTSCAVSGLRKNQFIEASQKANKNHQNIENVGARVSCYPPYDLSFMVSVIVPLPPIIPIWFVNKNESTLYIDTTSTIAKVTIQEYNSHNEIEVKKYKTYNYYTIPINCNNLDNAILKVTVINSDNTTYTLPDYRLSYSSELDMGWDYYQ